MRQSESEGLLVGARGYDHRSWRARFYPEELPSEWRFIFYSHRYPAVLMPPRAWGFDQARLVAWEEEAPPDFRVVLEIPEAGLEGLVGVEQWPRPLVCAGLVRLSCLTPGRLAALAVLAEKLPITVDFRGKDAGAEELARIGVGMCGRPGLGRGATGPFAMSLVGHADRPLLGHALRELTETRAPAGAALFLYRPETALARLNDAVLIARLLAGSP